MRSSYFCHKAMPVALICLLITGDLIIPSRSHALSPESSVEDPSFRCNFEVLSLLRAGRLRFIAQEDIEGSRLLDANNADVLLLSHGKILARDALRKDALMLLRKLRHEEIEAIMQIMASEERSKYSRLINIILSDDRIVDSYSVLKGRKKTASDIVANDIISTAFEMLLPISGKLMDRPAPASAEGVFLDAVSKVIDPNKHSYFDGKFWDDSVRQSVIRFYLANRPGHGFVQVASEPGADQIVKYFGYFCDVRNIADFGMNRFISASSDFEIVLKLPSLCRRSPIVLKSSWALWQESQGNVAKKLPEIIVEPVVQVGANEAYAQISVDGDKMVLHFIYEAGHLKIEEVPSVVLKEIRHKAFYYKFAERVRALGQDEDIYVSFGDIDHLHKINQVYGKHMTNKMLEDFSRIEADSLPETIRTGGGTLHDKEGWYYQFGGDETRILSPPGISFKDAYKQLDNLRRAVRLDLRRKYGVMSLNLLELKSRMPPDQFERLAGIVGELIICDQSRYRGKCLCLFYYDRKTSLEESARKTIDNVNKLLRAAGINEELTGRVDTTFSRGFMWGMTISQGMVSVKRLYRSYGRLRGVTGELAGLDEGQMQTFYHYVIEKAEEQLSRAKKTRDTIAVGTDAVKTKNNTVNFDPLTHGGREKLRAARANPSIPIIDRDFHDPRYQKESAFRSIVYDNIARGGTGTLVEVSCVYAGRPIEEGKAILGADALKELRGDWRGVGLRGINTIFGHEAGDVVIKSIADSFISVMPPSWLRETSAGRAPPLGRVTDRFYIYMYDKKIEDIETDVESFVLRLQDAINGNFAGGLRVNLTLNMVDTKHAKTGGELLRQLEYTSLMKDEYFAKAGISKESVIKSVERDNQVLVYNPAIENIAHLIQEERAFAAQSVLELVRPEGAHLRVRCAAVMAEDPYDFGEISQFTGTGDDDTITIDFQRKGRMIYRIGDHKDRISLLGRGGVSVALGEQLEWLKLGKQMNACRYLENAAGMTLKDIYRSFPVSGYSCPYDKKSVELAAAAIRERFLDRIDPGKDRVAIFFHQDADGMASAKIMELILLEYYSDAPSLTTRSYDKDSKKLPRIDFYSVSGSSDPLINKRKAAGDKTVVLDLNMEPSSRGIDLMIDHHQATDDTDIDSETVQANNPGIVVITPRVLGIKDIYGRDGDAQRRLSTTGNIMRPLIAELMGSYKASLFDSRYSWLVGISIVGEGLEERWKEYPLVYNIAKILGRVGDLSIKDAELGIKALDSYITEDHRNLEAAYNRYINVMSYIERISMAVYRGTEKDQQVSLFLRASDIPEELRSEDFSFAHAVLFELVDIERRHGRSRPFLVAGEKVVEGKRRLFPFAYLPHDQADASNSGIDLAAVMAKYGGGGYWHSAGVRAGVLPGPEETIEGLYGGLRFEFEMAIKNAVSRNVSRVAGAISEDMAGTGKNDQDKIISAVKEQLEKHFDAEEVEWIIGLAPTWTEQCVSVDELFSRCKDFADGWKQYRLWISGQAGEQELGLSDADIALFLEAKKYSTLKAHGAAPIVLIGMHDGIYEYWEGYRRALAAKIRGDRYIQAYLGLSGSSGSVETTVLAGKDTTPEELMFTSVLKDIGGLSWYEFGQVASETETIGASYEDQGRSLILYADDLFEKVMVVDLEHAIKNVIVKHGILKGGNIVIFARKPEYAAALVRLIRRADADIKPVTILASELGNLDGSETKEVSEVMALAKKKLKREGKSDQMLGLVKKLEKSYDETALRELAKTQKTPIAMIGYESGIYSLSEAVSKLMKVKAGSDEWLIHLEAIKSFTEQTIEKYKEYRRYLEEFAIKA